MKTKCFYSVCCALCLSILPLASHAISDAGEYVSRQGVVEDDYYAAGGEVTIAATVNGDVVVAGGKLVIGDAIEGDLLAAGGQVLIRGRVADDIRTAGGQIDIDARVGDDLIVSAGSVNVSADSSVGGNALLAGGEVVMAGNVGENLTIAAGQIRISGRVAGDVELNGSDIHIMQGARIEGDLHYNSPNMAIIDPDAIINGQVTQREIDWQEPSGGFGFVLPFSLMATGIFLYLLFPGFIRGSIAIIRDEPARSLIMGLVLVIVIPVVAIILMTIIVGLWIGLGLLLMYFIALLSGYLLACFFVGDWAAQLLKQDVSSKGRRILSFVLAVILIAVLGMVPLLGGLLVFGLLLLGLGAGVVQLQRRYQQAAAD